MADVSGTGSPVVLVHSGITDRQMWNRVLPGLEQSHRVVRFDLRGFGASSVPRSPFRHSDDLAAVMDQLELDRAGVVGASMGGVVAMEFAVAHPDRVAGLVLLASSLPGHDWSTELREYFDAEERALEHGDLDAAVELNLNTWIRGPARPWSEETRVLANEIRVSLRIALTNQPTNDEHELDTDLPVREALHRLDVPTLVAVGEADAPDFLAVGDHIVSRIPGARRVSLPGTGHLIAMERPDETVELIRDLLSTGRRHKAD